MNYQVPETPDEKVSMLTKTGILSCVVALIALNWHETNVAANIIIGAIMIAITVAFVKYKTRV